MKTEEQKEYIAPQVKVIKIVVEKGFAISAVILNDRYGGMEKHEVDSVVGW
jgi:hypothetical protein